MGIIPDHPVQDCITEYDEDKPACMRMGMTLKMWSRVFGLTGTGLECARGASMVLAPIAKSLLPLSVNIQSDCLSESLGPRYQSTSGRGSDISVFLRFDIGSMCLPSMRVYYMNQIWQRPVPSVVPVACAH